MRTIKPGKYQHFKGKKYEVIGVGRDSETLAEVVIYKALYRSGFGENALWVRPLDNFMQKVEKEGKELLRFKKIS